MKNFTDSTGKVIRIQSKALIVSRWVAVIGQSVTILIAHYFLELDFPVRACFLAVALSALVNIYSMARDKGGLPPYKTTIYLTYDILQLSALVFLTGGLANPFFMLLLCPVAIGATFLPLRQIVWLIFLSVFSVIMLAHFSLPLTLTSVSSASPHSLLLMGHFIAFSTACILTSLFGWRLSNENRAMQKAQEMIQSTIQQKRHLNSLGAQAAAAAHELGSPLSTIVVAARELANDAGKDSEFADDIQLIISQVERCKRILKEFGEQPDIHTNEYLLAPLPITHLIHEIAENFGHENPGVTIEITDALSAPVLVPQKPEIVHSLGVYIQNAIQRAHQNVVIKCADKEDMVVIEIADDGEGFDTAVISLLGQPLSHPLDEFKTEGNKRLGIFIAQNLLEELGARTVYSNDLNHGGAIVTIYWAKEKINT